MKADWGIILINEWIQCSVVKNRIVMRANLIRTYSLKSIGFPVFAFSVKLSNSCSYLALNKGSIWNKCISFFNAQYDVKIVKKMCTARTQKVFDIKIYVYKDFCYPTIYLLYIVQLMQRQRLVYQLLHSKQ